MDYQTQLRMRPRDSTARAVLVSHTHTIMGDASFSDSGDPPNWTDFIHEDNRRWVRCNKSEHRAEMLFQLPYYSW
ncbi:hypothetical protein ACKLNR_003411 [Fusarium oxysporum f. sp. zingiberi]|nr:hypothetical protein QWA68_005874 [Fusarium oxysporum]